MRKKLLLWALISAFLVTLCSCTQEVPPASPSPSPVVTDTLSPSSEATGALSPNPSPEPAPEPQEENFLLPVYTNTMAGGYHNLFAVTKDGSLLMWGYPEFTWGLHGGDPGGDPIVLMENVASIYTSVRGVIMAVDRNGTLWQLDTLEDDPYEPVWIMDDVAMVSAEFMRTLILKRDGTLFEWEFSNRDSQRPVNIPSSVVYAASSGYRCYAVDTNGALWEWDFGPEGFDPEVVSENVDWRKYQYKLNDDGSLTTQSVTLPNVVQAIGFFAVQEDGTLWHWRNTSWVDDPESAAPVKIGDSIKQIAVSEYEILVLKEDGSYWMAEFEWGSFGGSETQPLKFVRVYPKR